MLYFNFDRLHTLLIVYFNEEDYNDLGNIR